MLLLASLLCMFHSDQLQYRGCNERNIPPDVYSQNPFEVPVQQGLPELKQRTLPWRHMPSLVYIKG